MTHKDRIIQTLTGLDEPLTRIEIASATGTEARKIKNQLDELAKAGHIAVRQETAKERRARLGRSTVIHGRPANLYAAGKTVPPRTVAALVEGNMSSVRSISTPAPTVTALEAFITEGRNGNERREKAGRVKDALSHTFHTALELAAIAGVSDSFAREVLTAMQEDGEVESEKIKGKRGRRYRLARVLPVETDFSVPQQPVLPIEDEAPVAVAPIVPQASEETLQAVRVLLQAPARVEELELEIERLTNVNLDLATEVGMLQARNKDLEHFVRDLRAAMGQLHI